MNGRNALCMAQYEKLFGDFWFESPIYSFNYGNSLRFELLDKFPDNEERVLVFLKDIFNYLFGGSSKLYFIREHTKKPKIKPLELYGIPADTRFTFDFKTRGNELNSDMADLFDYKTKLACTVYDAPKSVFSISNFAFWIFKKGLVDYPLMVIADAEGKVFMQIYDSRGMDVVIKDKCLLKDIYLKYSDWILEYNREEILAKLKFDTSG